MTTNRSSTKSISPTQLTAQKAKSEYEDWKRAEANARIAEGELSMAWLRFDRNLGGPPSTEFANEVSAKRKTATDQLTLFLSALNRLLR